MVLPSGQYRLDSEACTIGLIISLSIYVKVLGVATINGEKRLVRKIYTKGPGGKVIQARLVYDYSELPVISEYFS